MSQALCVHWAAAAHHPLPLIRTATTGTEHHAAHRAHAAAAHAAATTTETALLLHGWLLCVVRLLLLVRHHAWLLPIPWRTAIPATKLLLLLRVAAVWGLLLSTVRRRPAGRAILLRRVACGAGFVVWMCPDRPGRGGARVNKEVALVAVDAVPWMGKVCQQSHAREDEDSARRHATHLSSHCFTQPAGSGRSSPLPALLSPPPPPPPAYVECGAGCGECGYEDGCPP